MTEHRLFPYFLIVAAGLIWGATFSLALIATEQLPPNKVRTRSACQHGRSH
jgi:hypothetical protein